MKIAHKIVLSSSLVLVLAMTVLSIFQYTEVKKTFLQQASSSINEESTALAHLITHFLNGKLAQVNLMAQMIDQDFRAETIQAVFDRPLLKKEFQLIFGGLENNGKTYSNDYSWVSDTWDARQRPWYQVARNANSAVLTEPYVDSDTNELLISAVANFTDNGNFKGAFGGDLSLKMISEALNSLNFNGAGYAFLMTKAGKVISHPNAELNGKPYAKIFSGQSPALNTSMKELEVDGETKLVAFTPLSGLSSMNWYIGVVLDNAVVMAPANTIGMHALIGVIVGVLLSIVIISAVIKHLLQPINQLYSSLLEINSGNGDLTKRLPITSNDEFGELGQQFNHFINHLQSLISAVKTLSQGVLSSTDQTASGSLLASERLQQQLQELDQLATAMTEMSSSAVEVASSAQSAATAASTADKVTHDSVNIIDRTTQAMSSLATEMDDAVSTVVDLAQFSDNIESILLVITGIADQTNLLALNAAIEAARAGESGRGFAVVADEVRSLASRTQESTSEIKKMIEQLQSGVRNAENKIKLSRDSALTTSEQVSQANDSLQTIRQAIVEINDMSLQIAAAAEEQSSTSEEINRNTTNIRDISQELANSSCEQAQLCEEMVQQVDQQEQQLNQFKV